MTTITRENFTAAMHTVVESRGRDFVYPEGWRSREGICRYILDDGTPACLIGAVLFEIDPALVEGLVSSESSYWVLDGLQVVDDGLTRAAGDAQRAQDHRKTWGEALDIYVESLR